MPLKYKEIVKKPVKINNPNQAWVEKNYPGFLHTIFMQGIHSGVWAMNKLYKFGFKFGYTICNDHELFWYWDARNLSRVRKLLIEKSRHNLLFFNKIYSRWRRDHAKNIAVYRRAEKINFSKLTNAKLYKIYEELYYANIIQGGSGYLADAFLSVGSADWLIGFINQQLGRIAKPEEIATLTAPTIPTYSNEENIDLFKIAKLPKNSQGNAFVRHAQKFYWVENNYFVKILTAADFAKRLPKSTVAQADYQVILKQNKINKIKLLRSLKNRHLTNVIRMSELATHMQDYRKLALVRFSHFYHLIITELAKQTGIRVQELFTLVEPEMKEIFLNKQLNKTILRKKLQERLKLCFAYGTPAGYRVYEGAELKKYVDLSVFKAKLTAGIAMGVPASPGLVRGRVCIVKDAHHADNFKTGDILVTNNTTPEFVPLMKRAAAIVTEQGGITTHAAIVSRELKIPCVIGTKIATQVFKDGDLVEVDANAGIVKIL